MQTTIKNLIMALGAGFIIVAAAAFAVSPALAEGYQVDRIGQVTGVQSWDHLNVRKWPAHYSQKIGELPPRAYVWVERCVTVEASSDWCQVARGPLLGWVNSRFLEPVAH